MEPKTLQQPETRTLHDTHADGEACACGMKQMQEEGTCCGGGCCSMEDEELTA